MSQTLVKEKDVIVYRNEASYSHHAVVELYIPVYGAYEGESDRVAVIKSSDGGASSCATESTARRPVATTRTGGIRL